MNPELSQELISVLTNEGRVSLPSLGTFSLVARPATVSTVEGRAVPPAKRVEFNGNLKIDDGRLARHLRETYQLAPELARARVAEFEKQIGLELSTGKLVNLMGVGRLFRDRNGELRFNASEYNFDKSSYGLPDIELEPVVRIERPAPAATPSTIPSPTPVYKLDTDPEPFAAVWEFLKRNVWYIAGITALICLLGILYLNNRNRPAAEQRTSMVIDSVEAPPGERVNVPPPEPPKIQTSTQADDAALPSSSDSEGDNDPLDSKNNTSPTTDERTPSASELPTTSEKYAIIALGLFGQQGNIDKNVTRITKAGYQPYTRSSGNLTRVGIRLNYTSEGELDRTLTKIRRQFSVQDAYIMEKNGRQYEQPRN
ncbi:MAG: hypothetical protein AAFU67_10280 [Bacteroidota bacterium]